MTMNSATRSWERWLDYGAIGPVEAEADHPPAKSETAVKRKIFNAVGNAENLKTAKNWTS